ncbi:hypothetical protein PQR02_31345 [Paraburkholderia sediminicola]|uniref:Uncharacterized protein n=1 Tax=Paraburkholderia rhynchosiae TaxID=487049 RepID=A0ACC7NKA1_9BURK
MSHTGEVVYLLHRAATLDAAVRALALALEMPNEEPGFALNGIAYKALSDLFARIHLCLPGDGEEPGETVVSLRIADTSDYSDDDTTRLDDSTYDDVTGRPSDLNRHRLSLSMAQALQANLPVLSAAETAP